MVKGAFGISASFLKSRISTGFPGPLSGAVLCLPALLARFGFCADICLGMLIAYSLCNVEVLTFWALFLRTLKGGALLADRFALE